MTAIIVPEKLETDAVRRGRAILAHTIERVLELHDRGKTPTKITISTALADDMRAFFDHATVFDGVLPRALAGVPIEYVPGAERAVGIACA